MRERQKEERKKGKKEREKKKRTNVNNTLRKIKSFFTVGPNIKQSIHYKSLWKFRKTLKVKLSYDTTFSGYLHKNF